MRHLTIPGLAAIAVLTVGAFNLQPASAAVIGYYDLTGTGGKGILNTSEPSAPNPGGTGGEIGLGIVLDNANDGDANTNLLHVNAGWGSSQGFTNLSSLSDNSHIHGPTANNNGSGFTQTAPVLFNLTRSSNAVTGGTFTSAPISLTSAQVTDLNNGKYYINIHTANNSGGELRGFIVPVPEPASLSFLGLGSIALLRRKRA